MIHFSIISLFIDVSIHIPFNSYLRRNTLGYPGQPGGRRGSQEGGRLPADTWGQTRGPGCFSGFGPTGERPLKVVNIGNHKISYDVYRKM